MLTHKNLLTSVDYMLKQKKIDMEDIVSFEIGRKLKKKGFRKECIYFYDTVGVLTDNLSNAIADGLFYSWNKDKTAWSCGHIDAPTIEQVLKWLREKGYHVYAELCYHSTEYRGFETIDKRWYSYRVIDIAKCKCHSGNREYDTCEEAEEAAIEYVLDNLL